MQGECNSKTVKQSFTGLDIAEPKPVLCKDNANERKGSLLILSRAQLVFYKDNARRVQQQDGKTKFYRT